MHNYADQMNWEDFRFALVIAQCGTFVKASEVLGVHHTTVARRLERLEQQLTTPLFYRHTRGVELTVAGQEMVRALSRVQEELQNLGVRLHGYDTTLTGLIRITTLAPFLDILSPHLHTFQKRYPHIEFEIILDERGLSLSQGEADIALRAGSIGSEEMVIPIKLAEIPFALYGAKAYFKAHPVPEKLDDLKQHKYVVLTTQVPKSFTWLQWLEEQVPVPHIGIRLNHPQGIPAAVKAGFGLGFLPCMDADGDETFQRVLLQQTWKSPLWMLVHRDRYRAAKIQAFIQFVKAVIQPALNAYLSGPDPDPELKGPVLRKRSILGNSRTTSSPPSPSSGVVNETSP
jgi:DNA-binding transcriptional LysR family regulator